MIDVAVRHNQGEFRLDASFNAAGGITSLFGASGSGKTTLIQIIAGLRKPQTGRVVFDGAIWNDTEKGIFVPPHRRRIGYVFQESRLFPHLDVRSNLLYGRFFAPRRERRIEEAEVVRLLGIERLLTDRPATLSGGERQRVAIGRALLSAPRLILMDEPLSALDRARKHEILPYIERVRDEFEIPIIYVSHAIEEVARLSRQVVLMDEGRVVKCGPPSRVFAELSTLSDPLVPQSVLDGIIVGHEPHFHLSIAEVGKSLVTLQLVDFAEGTPVRIRIPSSDVMLSLARPRGLSALNSLFATVRQLERQDANVLVVMETEGQTLIARVTLLSMERMGLVPGMRVHAVFKAVSADQSAGSIGG